VILSSHLLADVEDVCDRVVIYYGGRVQAMGTLKDLLATPDSIRITTPVLARETLQRVLDVVRADVAEDRVRIDTPTQNLESYFLGVVQKARESELQTSGATSGSRVAEYLRGEAEGPARVDRVLERLTVAPSPSAPQVSVPTPVQTIDVRKLEELTRPSAETPATAAPAATPAPAPADLAKADEKLAALLGKPK
jgi:ABC-2 type transport system ATP-binding protein